MKLLIIIAAVLPISLSNLINPDVQKYDCFVMHLRDKNLLDKKFKYTVESEDLECDSIITKFRHETLVIATQSTESTSDFQRKYFQNKKCIEEELSSMNYAELAMKMFIYERSKQLSKKVKKKFRNSDKDMMKKVTIAVTMCQPHSFYGEMFDGLVRVSNKSYSTLAEQKFDHCVRKYAVDKNLIDTTIFSIDINPYDIEINFNCDKVTKGFLETIKQRLKSAYEMLFDDAREVQCLNESMKSVDYAVKTMVLSKILLTIDQMEELRNEYIEKAKANQIELLNCLK